MNQQQDADGARKSSEQSAPTGDAEQAAQRSAARESIQAEVDAQREVRRAWGEEEGQVHSAEENGDDAH